MLVILPPSPGKPILGLSRQGGRKHSIPACRRENTREEITNLGTGARKIHEAYGQATRCEAEMTPFCHFQHQGLREPIVTMKTLGSTSVLKDIFRSVYQAVVVYCGAKGSPSFSRLQTFV